MHQSRASKTADIAAAVRAAHLLHDHPVVFDDPYALELTSPMWRTVCNSRLLHGLVVKRVFADFRSAHAEMLGRARYTEDLLLRAVANGLHQYVIVGAGLDSFALRRHDLAGRLRVFELDHPASQAVKRMRLATITPSRLPHVEFIAADFERESIAHALARSAYASWAPGFYAWLGNSYYLSAAAVESALRSIAGFAAPGSELVVDFARAAEALPQDEARAFLKTQAAVRRRGEPLLSFFEPEAFVALAQDCGFELVELLSPQAQQQRYFKGRDDGLRPAAWGHFAHLQVPRR